MIGVAPEATQARVHVIGGGIDPDQRRDGDFVGKDDRYRRTDEYLDVLRAIWTSEGPVDHVGDYYKSERARSDVQPVQSPHPLIFFGGASDSAIAVGAVRAGPVPEAVTSQRPLAHAADSEIHAERVFMPIAAATGATGNTTCLVGTPDQVADRDSRQDDVI